MKRLTATIAALTLSGMALAGPPHGPRGGLYEQLDLSDEQRQQMREIRAAGGGRDEMRAVLTPEQQEKARALYEERGKHRGGRLERMQQALDLSDEQVEEMRAIRASGGSRDEVRAVLTEEQRARFDAMKRQHREGRPPQAG